MNGGSEPFALVRKDVRGVRVAAVNASARQGGVEEDMRLADARALLPVLITRPHDDEADAATLHDLADWCLRYTPIVAIDSTAPNASISSRGLWLDITGAAHLCGGEEGLLTDLSTRLNAIGFEHRIALAQTPGAAWALARFGTSRAQPWAVALTGKLDRALIPLPLDALRLDDNALYLLRRFGLRTIGALRELPRAGLKRRFPSREVCEAVLHRLDQAYGQAAEPFVPLRPVPVYLERLAFAEPILATQSFYLGLDELLEPLLRRMEEDRKGVTRLTFTACHADGGLSRISIATARASRDKAHLAMLFRDRIEKLNPGYGIDLLILSADAVEPLGTQQMALSALTSREHDTISHLVDRLSNRLGAANVQRIARRESHVPERAENRKPALEIPYETAGPSPDPQFVSSRPFRLLEKPEILQVMAEVPEGPPRQFTWRRVRHRVVHAEGPERIAPEWWALPQSVRQRTRDYYRVEDDAGRRFWIFREGLYGEGGKRNASAPTWHMHGLFP